MNLRRIDNPKKKKQQTYKEYDMIYIHKNEKFCDYQCMLLTGKRYDLYSLIIVTIKRIDGSEYINKISHWNKDNIVIIDNKHSIPRKAIKKVLGKEGMKNIG